MPTTALESDQAISCMAFLLSETQFGVPSVDLVL
jgi:hypothetical protein